jgi:hypothetical protein
MLLVGTLVQTKNNLILRVTKAGKLVNILEDAYGNQWVKVRFIPFLIAAY